MLLKRARRSFCDASRLATFVDESSLENHPRGRGILCTHPLSGAGPLERKMFARNRGSHFGRIMPEQIEHSGRRFVKVIPTWSSQKKNKKNIFIIAPVLASGNLSLAEATIFSRFLLTGTQENRRYISAHAPGPPVTHGAVYLMSGPGTVPRMENRRKRPPRRRRG